MTKRTSRERLDHLVRTADRLEAEHELDGLTTRLTMKADGSGWNSTLEEPELHRLRSLVMALRPYLLVEDDTYLPTVVKDCRAHLRHDAALRAIENAERGFDRAKGVGWFRLELGGQVVTPEDATNLFPYGELFHVDKDKDDRLAELPPAIRGLLREQFIGFMFNVAEITAWTASVVRYERDRGALEP